jgi:FPC/CPF motif-containing protein YcgG
MSTHHFRLRQLPLFFTTGVDTVGDRRWVKGNPFSAPGALENSSLHWGQKGSLIAADDVARSDRFLHDTHSVFRELVLQSGFSCIGAKAALHDDAYGFATYQELGSMDSTAGLSRDLCHFAQSKVIDESEYATFVAVFRDARDIDEAKFEQLLWQQLYQLHAADTAYFTWDSSVSANPNDPQFSFSFAGRAFYVIGMHPASSRTARTFSWPALVFNPHQQFERLRSDGQWKKMQKAIRARELVLQGSVNPMLSDFGDKSEARQYSGRTVTEDWAPPVSSKNGKCPFGH